MMAKIQKAIKNPRMVLSTLILKKPFRRLPDKAYIKLQYFLMIGRKINLSDPKTLNEKLQWLKLNDRKKEHMQLVDKFEVREYVRRVIGATYLIPIYGLYSSFDAIDFDVLPPSFVLKPTHTSGNVFICEDKSKIDYDHLRTMVNAWLKRDYYWYFREWPYKNIKPRILCEKLMKQASQSVLIDYKFYCFNGNPNFIQVISNRKGSHFNANYLDLDWQALDIKRDKYLENPDLEKPRNLEDMIRISRLLSENKKFVRIDLYEIEGKVYFGEVTFFPASGYIKYGDAKTDALLGALLNLD